MKLKAVGRKLCVSGRKLVPCCGTQSSDPCCLVAGVLGSFPPAGAPSKSAVSSINSTLDVTASRWTYAGNQPGQRFTAPDVTATVQLSETGTQTISLCQGVQNSITGDAHDRSWIARPSAGYTVQNFGVAYAGAAPVFQDGFFKAPGVVVDINAQVQYIADIYDRPTSLPVNDNPPEFTLTQAGFDATKVVGKFTAYLGVFGVYWDGNAAHGVTNSGASPALYLYVDSAGKYSASIFASSATEYVSGTVAVSNPSPGNYTFTIDLIAHAYAASGQNLQSPDVRVSGTVAVTSNMASCTGGTTVPPAAACQSIIYQHDSMSAPSPAPSVPILPALQPGADHIDAGGALISD